MRVGAFARGLLLKGECSVELVLMTTTKPNMTLFNALSSRMPAKFEVGVSNSVHSLIRRLLCAGVESV